MHLLHFGGYGVRPAVGVENHSVDLGLDVVSVQLEVARYQVAGDWMEWLGIEFFVGDDDKLLLKLYLRQF